MNASHDLLAYCRDFGVELFPQGSELWYDGPEEAITDELIEQIRAHKAELMAILRNGALIDSSSTGSISSAVGSAGEPDELDGWESFTNEFGLPGCRRIGEWWPEVGHTGIPCRSTVGDWQADLARAAARLRIGCPYSRPLVRGPGLEPTLVSAVAIPPNAMEYQHAGRWLPIRDHWRPDLDPGL
jgi:hypothetical protein